LNKDSVKNKIRDFNRDDDETTDVDVLFIGENIVEAWAGRAMSYNTTNFRQIKDSFDSRFNKEKGGKYDGLALGIAGDTVSFIACTDQQILAIHQKSNQK